MIKFQNKRRTGTLLISALIFLFSQSIKANPAEDNLVLLKNLTGRWQFSIGINDEWISPKFDDSKWESIHVPSPWEDQGFNGYNGYGFYRKNIEIPVSYTHLTLPTKRIV